ncbi:MAG: hypothetical protein WCF33_17890 [Pseudonocardiaceae bacterium]
MAVEQRGNEVLGTLLAELSWSPSQVANAVNGLLGPGYVARSPSRNGCTRIGCPVLRCPPWWPT